MEKEFEINKIIEEFEKTLQWKRGGSIDERLSHVLGQYRQIADNSIYKETLIAMPYNGLELCVCTGI